MPSPNCNDMDGVVQPNEYSQKLPCVTHNDKNSTKKPDTQESEFNSITRKTIIVKNGFLYKARRHGLNVRQYWQQTFLVLNGSELCIYRTENGFNDGGNVHYSSANVDDDGSMASKKGVTVLELGPGCRIDDTGLIRSGRKVKVQMFTR